MNIEKQRIIKQFFDEHWDQWIAQKYYYPYQFKQFYNWFDRMGYPFPGPNNLSRMIFQLTRQKGYFFERNVYAWLNGRYDYFYIFTKCHGRPYTDVFPNPENMTDEEMEQRRIEKEMNKQLKAMGL